MQKIMKEDREIIVNNMPESFRKLYESGMVIRIKILRSKPLKRYGDEINLTLCGENIIKTDLDEYEKPEDIANRILSYFLYGEKGPVLIRNNHDWVGYDFGIRFAL